MWHMMKNQNSSYFAQVSLETWWDYFLEIVFETRQKITN